MQGQIQITEYAGFWVRAWASIIDVILISFITFPLLMLIYGSAYFDGGEDLVAGSADILISGVLPAIIVVIFWVKKQATPGKMALSVKIVDATTGQPASNAQLVGRYLAYFVSMTPLFLGVFWIAFDKRKQGWHDKLAGTVVIKNLIPSQTYTSE